jgi:hypothetical protein
MLTANAPLSVIAATDSERLSTETRQSRGSSDTEQKALAVSPRTTPSGPLLVMTVTLLAKLAIRAKNCSRSTVTRASRFSARSVSRAIVLRDR